MATADTFLTTANDEKIAAKSLGGGVKAQAQVWVRADGAIMGGADLPVTVEADATIDAAQQSATIGVLGEIRDNVADALAAIGGEGAAIESAGHTALPEYGTYTDAQELADVVDLFAADVIARLEALEA